MRFEMDGLWDIDDLADVAESMRLGYAYFYWIEQEPHNVDERIASLFARQFWSGEKVDDYFTERLYGFIPDEHKLRVKSIQYASPGWLELAGLGGALLVFARATSAWCDAAAKVIQTYEKVEKFFQDRKLRTVPRSFKTESLPDGTIVEADKICHEFGAVIGLPRRTVNRVIDLTGNPISALRVLAAISKEQRRMADLEGRRLLKLPRFPPSSGSNDDSNRA